MNSLPINQILIGDNYALLQSLPDSSVHSVITDPPYGLGREPNAEALLQDWIIHGYHEITSVGGGFMGKQWDTFVPQPVFWKEVFRVLTEGGHVLCFGGTRTYDWSTIALRLAGFEIRDSLQWLYGGGFPKPHNISKAIDRESGAVRAVSELGRDDQPITPDAEKWDGWGNALKPAHEPIIMARKPFNGTIARNVVQHGTGALNIDGCRVAHNGDIREEKIERSAKTGSVYGKFSDRSGEVTWKSSAQGRYPANVLHDGSDAVIESLPNSKDKKRQETREYQPASKPLLQPRNAFKFFRGGVATPTYDDSGSVARYFYCARASPSERDMGLSGGRNIHPTVKPVELMRWLCRLVTPPEGVVLDPFAGSGTTCVAALKEGFAYIGMEQSEEYAAIAESRIMTARNRPETLLLFTDES